MTIFELMDIIQTKDKALLLFQRIRWKDGLLCNACGAYNSAYKHGKTKSGFQRYKCCCGYVFSDTSNTPFHRKRTDVRHWIFALYEISQNKSITSTELAVKLGIRQKKAWYILDTLREYCIRLMKPLEQLVMRGVIESDEAYFGKGDNSTMVQGVVQRGKHAVIVPITDRTEITLKGNIKVRAMKKSYIMTDTAASYGGLDCADYKHFTLNHSKDEYSKGNGIHSNTIEGLWGNLKKQIYGVHHGVSKKNLMKYVSEHLTKYSLHKANLSFPTFLHQFIIPPLTC